MSEATFSETTYGGTGPESYERFFELWKDADPDLPLLRQAREEFAKLTGS